MVKWRARCWVWAVALGLPVLVIVLSAALNAQLWGAPSLDWTDVSLTGVAASFAVRLINPLDGPMGEEPGWRGYALPRLLSTMSPLRSAATLGVVVAVWHLPFMGITGDDLTTYAIVWTIVAALLVLADRRAWRSPSSSRPAGRADAWSDRPVTGVH